MSNWSVVIVSWPTTDGGPCELTQRHLRRLEEVTKTYRELCCAPAEPKRLGWTVVSNIEDRVLVSPQLCVDGPRRRQQAAQGGLACEFVAVAQEDGFMPDDLATALAAYPWQYPEKVAFMWKDENMDTWGYGRLAVKDPD